MPDAATTAVRRLAILAAFLLALAPAAGAQTWNEVGDAFPYVQAAQQTVGSGPLTLINGTLDQDADADVFCVRLVATPPAGAPLLWMNCVVHNGPNVYLFDAAGVGVATNYTCQAGQKLIVAPNVSLPPGNYYVAVSYTGWEPSSLAGAIWLSALPGQRAPDGPGAAGALWGWGGTGLVQPMNPYSVGLSAAWFGYCDAATPSAKPTWGALKIRY